MISKRARNTVLAAATLIVVARSLYPDAAAAPVADACGLLTQEQVSRALGVTVGPGSLIMGGSPRVCGWAEPAKSAPAAKKVVVSLMTGPQYAVGKEPMKGVDNEPLKGLGDEAYYITAGAFGTGLTVKKGDAYFQVRVGGFPKPQVMDMEKSLALLIVPKV